jgi:hypothetical protein
MKKPTWTITILLAGSLLAASCAAPATPTIVPASLPPSLSFPTPAPVSSLSEGAASSPPAADPYALISEDSLLATLQDLTSIQPHSGWRSSGTKGEREGIEYVAARLGEMPYLSGLGMALERQTFHVFTATELWETRLFLSLAGRETEVPADGLRGHRDDLNIASRADSDGTLNDTRRDPVTVEGRVALARSAEEIEQLGTKDLADKVLFVDYAAIDRAVLGKPAAAEIATQLLQKQPAGLVLVTRYSNKAGESHGTFVGDVSALNDVKEAARIPVLSTRLEDLAPAGIASWEDLARVETARLVWDADVLAPGTSGNLAAHIPGLDPSRAVILGAHIDSPNCPGAMDDGAGSAVLLEVARVLDAARVQPARDLYLVWFGSEELGLYGSYHFASTHQDLLDRTLSMQQIDCLLHPLDGIHAYLNLVSWSYGRFGDESLAWPDYLHAKAASRGVETYPVNNYGIESDNSAFSGFDVPNSNLIYMNFPDMDPIGGVHYAGHLHDPYDAVELAREVSDVLVQMAKVALIAALESPLGDRPLHAAPRPDLRALFVASHTEAVHMSPTTFTDLGMALAWEGLDVDVIPYGQAVTAADLADAALVVALPVLDYPSGDADVYDEAWSEEEVSSLEAYVANGGLLVLTNSLHRLKYIGMVTDANEDWADANLLAERFGVTYEQGALEGGEAQTRTRHALVRGLKTLALAEGNAVPFAAAGGRILATVGGNPAMALLPVGKAGGEVLVLADVGMLGSGEEPANLPFWRNLAAYARAR